MNGVWYDSQNSDLLTKVEKDIENFLKYNN